MNLHGTHKKIGMEKRKGTLYDFMLITDRIKKCTGKLATGPRPGAIKESEIQAQFLIFAVLGI